MSEAQLHAEQLQAVLIWLRREEWPASKGEWLQNSLDAFESMQARGNYPLSEKQIKWVRDVADAADIDLPEPPRTPAPSGLAPGAKPVELLISTMPRPLAPPGKKPT